MYVEAVLLEVTRVCTLTLPNSVILHCGIPSVNARSSSELGLSWIFLAFRTTGSSPRWGSGPAILASRPSRPGSWEHGARASRLPSTGVTRPGGGLRRAVPNRIDKRVWAGLCVVYVVWGSTYL